MPKWKREYDFREKWTEEVRDELKLTTTNE